MIDEIYFKKDALTGAIESSLLGEFLKFMQAPPSISTADWASANRILTSDVSPKPGKYDPMVTPYMLLVMKKLDDPRVRVVIGRKSAQIAWTEVINNYFGRRIANDPCNILVAFPTRGTGTSYSAEKLKPFIINTPALYKAIGNPNRLSWDRIPYPGGFMKLLTAGSISNLKSTTASVVDVEEPDDLKADVSQQGDALTILKERLKAHPDSKFIFGGTPANKGSSKVDEAYEGSCQYKYKVPCHECGDFHTLSFDNLILEPYGKHKYDKKFGEFDPKTATYQCPHCKAHWSDKQKNINVREAVNFHEDGWEAQVPDADEVGFDFNELMSPFAGSTLYELAKKRAVAQVDYDRGDDKKLKSWQNNSEGRAYSPPQDDLNLEVMQDKALAYPMGIVPKGGVTLTAGVDIQHNRFHLIVRAFGAKGCSWLVRREELFGNVLDYSSPVWTALKRVLLATYPLEENQSIRVGLSAVSIDTSDGNTSELAYRFVQELNILGLKALAAKGSSEHGTKNVEIFTQPTNKLLNDAQKVKSLAEMMGVNLYIVGSNKAKDTLLRQLKQSGDYDRLYYPQGINPAYFDQMLSNVKMTSARNKIKYTLISGRRDEDLDCEQLALHASRALYVHLLTDRDWQQSYLQLLEQQPENQVQAQPAVSVTKGLGLQQR